MRRNTVQKTLLLEAVCSMTTHPTADEIYEIVSERCPGISKGTVYRGLNQLAEDGKILRVAIANAPDRYDLTVGDHAHCICNECGRVFDYRLLRDPEIDKSNGDFNVTSIELVLRGKCSECNAKDSEFSQHDS